MYIYIYTNLDMICIYHWETTKCCGTYATCMDPMDDICSLRISISQLHVRSRYWSSLEWMVDK